MRQKRRTSSSQTLVSFAQSYEDVVLYAMLIDIEQGIYVDVGAQDPTTDSVSKFFYDRGWHGINIEPVVEWHSRLCSDRPRDINLQIAASSKSGTIKIYEVGGTGLSSVVPDFANRASSERNLPLREYDVATQTLNAICAEHKITEIHFLKIDVEGHEAAVLAGFSFSKVRPWIVVVESVEPDSRIPNFDKWEHYLTDRDYVYVHTDGLNRFYLAKEHAELKAALDPLPNAATMGFVRWGEVRLWQLAEGRKGELEAGKQKVEEANRETERARLETEHAKQQSERAKQDAEFAKLETAHAKLEAEHAKLELTNAKLETENAKLALTNAKEQAEHAKREVELSKRAEVIDSLHQQLLQEEAKNHSLIREVERLVRTLERASQDQELRKNEARQLYDQSEARQRDVERLQTESEAQHREVERLHRELEARQAEVERLQRESETRHREVKRLLREIEVRQSEAERRQRELETQQREVERLNGELEVRQREAIKTYNEMERQKRESERLEYELKGKRRESERLYGEFEIRKREIERLHSELEASALELRKGSLQLAAAEEQLAICSAELATFGAQVGSWLNRQRHRLAPVGTTRDRILSLLGRAVRVTRQEGFRRAVWKSMRYLARRRIRG